MVACIIPASFVFFFPHHSIAPAFMDGGREHLKQDFSRFSSNSREIPEKVSGAGALPPLLGGYSTHRKIAHRRGERCLRREAKTAHNTRPCPSLMSLAARTPIPPMGFSRAAQKRKEVLWGKESCRAIYRNGIQFLERHLGDTRKLNWGHATDCSRSLSGRSGMGWDKRGDFGMAPSSQIMCKLDPQHHTDGGGRQNRSQGGERIVWT
jgi:hypothetical protein